MTSIRSGACVPALVLVLVLWASLAWAVAPSAPTVSPAGPRVPENLLRIELRFDAALRRPVDLRNVKLLDARGAEIEAPFLDLPLPGRDGHTVTLLLHPGRIKTGVAPNLALGPVLHAGETVTLVVDGPAMGAPLRKTWVVTAALRQPIDPSAWRFEPPSAGSMAPLQVVLDRPLAADALHRLAIADAQGRKLAGSVRMDGDEQRWQFTPARPWLAGAHSLRVHPALEDVAGNRLCAAFEQATLSAVDCSTGGERPFQVRPVVTRPVRWQPVFPP